MNAKERIMELKSENEQYLEGLLKLYKDICVGGKYDKRMPKHTAYNIILDIERIAESVSGLKEEIDSFLESEINDYNSK